MKFVHLSDLHIGKRINDFSLLEDQEYILLEILAVIDEQKPDAVIIAGDVYDKSVPSAEAVQLFDEFLTHLAHRDLFVFVISGNHDSPERIAFGAQLMTGRNVYMSPVFNGALEPITLTDVYGDVNIYLLPFVRPANVRRYFPEAAIANYHDAVKTLMEETFVDTDKRNVLVAHQFITGAATCESEDISIGGLDNVDASAFASFDYVALGHIHGPQCVSRETIRYCGTPLKYSFSEARHTKSVTVVDLGAKGDIDITTVPLKPRRELREVKGSFAEITAPEARRGASTDDYIHATLTDEEDVIDAIGKLRTIYPHIMRLDYDNARTKAQHAVTGGIEIKDHQPLELFAEFYEMQNNKAMSDEQQVFVSALIEKIWGERR